MPWTQTDALGCSVAAVADVPRVAVAASSNEQKRLWGLVRSTQAAVGRQSFADHALVSDVGIDAEGGRCYVHLVLCTAKGEPVLADFQNDQSPAVAGSPPRTLADAEALLVARLVALLK